MKIMIVDDHKGMREMMRSVMVPLGAEVCECQDGSEALEAYRRFQPEWVLMDIVMKKLDGISATRQILAQFPEAQIVIVSEHRDGEVRAAALAAGAIGFVAKENLLELPRLVLKPARLPAEHPNHQPT